MTTRPWSAACCRRSRCASACRRRARALPASSSAPTGAALSRRRGSPASRPTEATRVFGRPEPLPPETEALAEPWPTAEAQGRYLDRFHALMTP